MGANFRVNDDGVNVGNQYEPDVSGDSSGRFVVAWMDGRTGDWNIFCQRFNSQGQRQGTNIQVTTDEDIQWTADVSCGVNGDSWSPGTTAEMATGTCMVSAMLPTALPTARTSRSMTTGAALISMPPGRQ